MLSDNPDILYVQFNKLCLCKQKIIICYGRIESSPGIYLHPGYFTPPRPLETGVWIPCTVTCCNIITGYDAICRRKMSSFLVLFQTVGMPAPKSVKITKNSRIYR
jgi:hypothetical protein